MLTELSSPRSLTKNIAPGEVRIGGTSRTVHSSLHPNTEIGTFQAPLGLSDQYPEEYPRSAVGDQGTSRQLER
jgi:hypothetical protein